MWSSIGVIKFWRVLWMSQLLQTIGDNKVFYKFYPYLSILKKIRMWFKNSLLLSIWSKYDNIMQDDSFFNVLTIDSAFLLANQIIKAL